MTGSQAVPYRPIVSIVRLIAVEGTTLRLAAVDDEQAERLGLRDFGREGANP